MWLLLLFLLVAMLWGRGDDQVAVDDLIQKRQAPFLPDKLAVATWNDKRNEYLLNSGTDRRIAYCQHG